MITRGFGSNQHIVLRGFGLLKALKSLGRIEDLSASISSDCYFGSTDTVDGDISTSEFLALILDNSYHGFVFVDEETGVVITDTQIAQITNQLSGSISMDDYQGNIIEIEFAGSAISNNTASISEDEYSGEISEWRN